MPDEFCNHLYISGRICEYTQDNFGFCLDKAWELCYNCKEIIL